MVKGPSAEWGKCFCMVLLDIFTQTLSYWNKTIAIEFGLGDIIILDAVTGRQKAILSEHVGWVNFIQFACGTSRQESAIKPYSRNIMHTMPASLPQTLNTSYLCLVIKSGSGTIMATESNLHVMAFTLLSPQMELSL